jgi:hypothetical protein
MKFMLNFSSGLWYTSRFPFLFPNLYPRILAITLAFAFQCFEEVASTLFWNFLESL